MVVDSWACYIEQLLQFGDMFAESSIQRLFTGPETKRNLWECLRLIICGSLPPHAVSYNILFEWSNLVFLFLNRNFLRYVSTYTQMQFYPRTFHRQPRLLSENSERMLLSETEPCKKLTFIASGKINEFQNSTHKGVPIILEVWL